jgi:hypothetical protein
LAESLRVAHQSGALPTRDLARVTIDTTVQPQAISTTTLKATTIACRQWWPIWSVNKWP